MRAPKVGFAVSASLAAALAFVSPAAAVATTAAASCSGTDTWTSLAGDTQWTTGGNWSLNAPPAADQIAVLPTVAADSVELNGDATVCELQLEPETSLLIDAGHTLTAEEIDIAGGSAANAYTALTGQVTTTDLHVGSGFTNVAEADAMTPVTETTSTFELDAGANLSLSDSAVTLKASGTATLGGSASTTHFDSNSTSGGDDSAKFDVDATARLAGDVDSSGLDVVTTASSVIDTAGHTWSVHGDAFSRFAGGTTVESSAPGGVYAIGDQDHVLVSGLVTVAHGSTLRLQDTGMITDGRYFQMNGAPLATVGGTGKLVWSGGEFTGHVDLAKTLKTVASGSGDRHVADPTFGRSVLTNAGSFTLQGGSMILDDGKDSFVNTGSVKATGGHFGANTSAAPPLQNAKTGHWTVAPAGASTSKITDGSFRNNGQLTIAAKKTLVVGNGFRQTKTGTTSFTVSSATAASRLRASGLSLAGTAHVSSAAGFKPHRATVKGLIKAHTRSGTFGHVASTTHRAHTAWHLKYRGGFVDAVLR